jgi:hypothetical protein
MVTEALLSHIYLPAQHGSLGEDTAIVCRLFHMTSAYVFKHGVTDTLLYIKWSPSALCTVSSH